MRAGEVRAVRELTGRVQAEVCLGADATLGYATIKVETSSPAVMAALAALKQALRDEAKGFVGDVLQGQAAWDKEMKR